MRITLLVFAFAAGLHLSAQTFCKSYGDPGIEYAGKMIATSDDGFLFTGNTNSWSGEFMDLFVLKLDTAGNTEWSTIVYTDLEDIGKSAVELADGTYMITGATYTDAKGYDIAFIHLNHEGELITATYFGDETYNWGNKIISTPDSGFTIVGYSDTIGDALITFQPLIMKINAAGEMEWGKRFSVCGDCSGEALDILQLQDESFIVTGYISTGFAVTTTDMFVAKFNSEGILQWLNRSGNHDNYESGNSIIKAVNNGFIVAGTSVDETYDIYIAKISEDGITTDQKVIDDNTGETAAQIIQTNDHQYAIGGTRMSGDDDYYLVKLDTSLQIIFTSQAGIEEIENATALVQTPKNNYVISGHSVPAGSFADDLYLLQFDSLGNNCCRNDSGGIVSDYPGDFQTGGFDFPVIFTSTSGAAFFNGGNEIIYCEDTIPKDTIIQNIQVVDPAANFIIFPNPSAGLFTIKSLSENHFPERIEILDASQRIIFIDENPQFINLELPVDLRVYQDGIYFIKIFQNGLSTVYPLMLTHEN